MDVFDRIDAEACQWLVLAEDGGLDDYRQREFDAWYAADPRHSAAFDAARALWDEMPGFGNLAALAPPTPAPALGSEPFPRRLRYTAGALAAVAAVLLALIFVPADMLRRDPHYRTDLAETRIVTLPDGSSVTLGARSAIKVRFSGDERRIVLATGEALFDVVHDPARPFLVEAGDSIIHDIGTKFDVNLTKGAVRVSVLEGLVSVARTGAHERVKPQLLKAGERAEIARIAPRRGESSMLSSMAEAQPIVALSAHAPGAWREGRLVFDNVRLADLADDVNRYYAPGVNVAPELRDLRVTAAFKTSEVPTFMRSLSESFPVHVTSSESGSFDVTAAGR